MALGEWDLGGKGGRAFWAEVWGWAESLRLGLGAETSWIMGGAEMWEQVRSGEALKAKRGSSQSAREPLLAGEPDSDVLLSADTQFPSPLFPGNPTKPRRQEAR